MRRACIRGVSRRRGFVETTQRDAKNKPAPDLVNPNSLLAVRTAWGSPT